MTEPDWLACANPKPMLAFLRGKGSQRKLRLFAVACCARVWSLFTDERSRTAIQIAEQFDDGLATAEDLENARAAAQEARADVVRPGESHYYWYGDASAEAAVACTATQAFPPLDRPATQHEYFTTAAGGAANAKAAHHLWSIEQAEPLEQITDDWVYDEARERREEQFHQLWEETRRAEWTEQAVLLRDIFPFRPPEFSPNWRTDTAIAIGQQMYDTGEFGAMPILADALQDAGCDSEDILDHCRSDGPHVRGCWVVDLVLGLG